MKMQFLDLLKARINKNEMEPASTPKCNWSALFYRVSLQKHARLFSEMTEDNSLIH